MSEQKFRGKSKWRNQWTYGSLVTSKPSVDGIIQAWVIEPSVMPFGARSTPTENFKEVHLETVGQYTGSKDHDVKEVYEGDLVDGDGKFVVVFADSAWWLYSTENEIDKYSFAECNISACVIIGNIHEGRQN